MDVKTESKLILSALLIMPLGVGVVMLIDGAWGIYPYVMFLIGLLGLLYLWIPRKDNKKDHRRKQHKQHKKH